MKLRWAESVRKTGMRWMRGKRETDRRKLQGLLGKAPVVLTANL